MATRLIDIANQVNVSTTIVSRVLNNKPGTWASDETRQRILDVARELRYRPSAAGRALVTGRTMQIAVSAADYDWVRGRGGRMLQMRGLIDFAADNYYSILVVPSSGFHADSRQFEEWVEGAKCDGFCVFAEQCDASIYRYFREQDVPFVVIGNPGDDTVPQVDNDNSGYLHDCVNWLADQGHQHIAFIDPTPIGEEQPPHVQVKLNGLREALETRFGSFNPASAPRGCKTNDDVLDLVRGPNAPSAVILTGLPRVAQWQTQMLKHGIRVPDDITLLAILDVSELSYLERSYMTEGLACLTYDPRTIGAMAGEMLIEWIAGAAPIPSQRLVPSEKPFWAIEAMSGLPEW